MKHYLLSIQQPDGGPAAPEVLEPIMRDVKAFNDELRAAGAWVFAGGLHDPGTATVVRVRDGEVLVTDGPYAEGKEHVGGLSVIAAPDLDAALEWGGKLARATTLPVEVRPFQGEPGEHLP
ncbi:DGPFAETKE family protein [Planomonospora sphaerica]|uniref:DGPFAETKE family protein n=1 Tax=Planomonospora sphaerica TaxID=161355 RepID=A0A171DNT6_9ACTN|nr:YciI family protein [Planomonospora sphaerica]GAT70718.1 DGPFAETKE family protein [Planomonospora sphaerica]